MAVLALASGGCAGIPEQPPAVHEQPNRTQSRSDRCLSHVDGSDYLLDDPDIPPLLRAVAQCDSAKAHALLASGAKVNVADRYGFTPLMIAVDRTREAVPEILAAGAAVDARDKVEGETALFIAARLGDLASARELIKSGADVNAASIYGDTPLAEAAGRCRVPVVRLLVENGADVNAKNEGGVTPLMSAVIGDCSPVAETLVKDGANVNAKDRQGRSALSMAERSGASRVVRMLIRAGARR